MSSLLRFKMVDAAINHTAVEVKVPEGRPSDYFGKKVFGRAAMRKYLDKRTYAALLDTMEKRTPLTREVADSIAAGMRQWALGRGCFFFTSVAVGGWGGGGLCGSRRLQKKKKKSR